MYFYKSPKEFLEILFGEWMNKQADEWMMNTLKISIPWKFLFKFYCSNITLH